MKKKLEFLIESMPIIKNMIDGDFAITITDKSECLYVIEGEKFKSLLMLGRIGDKELKGVKKVISEGKISHQVLTKELDGVDLMLTVIPVIDENGEGIGTIALSRSMEKQAKIKNTADELMTSLEESSATVQEIAKGALKLSENLNIVMEKTKLAEKDIEKSNEFVNLIKNIAKQSNLLGLNASIEAARANDHGRGFSVVASELRKLSSMSADSSQKISSSLADMSNSMKMILDAIQRLGGIAEVQASATEELSSTVEQITENSQVLVDNVRYY